MGVTGIEEGSFPGDGEGPGIADFDIGGVGSAAYPGEEGEGDAGEFAGHFFIFGEALAFATDFGGILAGEGDYAIGRVGVFAEFEVHPDATKEQEGGNHEQEQSAEEPGALFFS